MLKISSATIAIILIISGCGGPETMKDDSRFRDDRVIVRVGDHVLTLGQVHRNFRDVEFDDAQDEFEEKKNYIESEIDRFLQIDGAKEAGLSFEADSSIIKGYLFQELYKRDAGISSEVSDSDVEEHFDRYGGEVQFGPLMVKDSVLIDSIYQLLENGADWDSLVLEHSIVRIGRNRGGSLGYVPFGQYDENIQGKAYDLDIGEYSKPFRAKFGWCIVKLFDRIKDSSEYLEQNWDTYKLVTTNYSEILQTDEYKENLLDDYNYRINWQNVDLLIQKSDSVKNIGKLPADMPGSAFLDRSAFTPTQLDLFLAEFKGGGVTVTEYLDLMESFNPYKSPELRDRFEVEMILKDMATRKVMLKRALELRYDTLQTFKEAIEYYEGNWLIKEFHEKLFAQLDTVTEADIEKYYSEHPEDSYRPEQMRASAISLKTEEEALEILEKLKMGASFTALAQKYSTDKKTASLGGDLNFFTEKRNTEIYNAARDKDIGEIGGPVEMYGNYWVFKVTDKLERELKPLRLARSNIRSNIWTDRRIQAVESWLEKRKANTDYFLDLDLLKNDLGIPADVKIRTGDEEETE